MLSNRRLRRPASFKINLQAKPEHERFGLSRLLCGIMNRSFRRLARRKKNMGWKLIFGRAHLGRVFRDVQTAIRLPFNQIGNGKI